MVKPPHSNILVIGDLHEPFCLDAYLGFCKDVKKTYKINHTIFIGDIIDNHYSSYHETDPDGYGAGQELQRAIDRLKLWHDAFPNADVCIGNHDRIASRKIFSAGLSKRWMRDINDVLQVPTWNFQVSFHYHGVKYVHGDKGATARSKSLKQGCSIVQGHNHGESYVWNNAGTKTWGMQVGCGIDQESYAMSYAAEHTMALSCGVVLNDGNLPIIIPMYGQ